MEDKLIHSISLSFADWVNQYVPVRKEGKDYLKLVYGTEVMIMNVSKLIVVFVITMLLGTLVQTIAVLVGFNFIRRFSFGLHAKNSTVCTISSIFMFVLIPWLLKGFVIYNLEVLPIFCAIILCLFLYAPADTDSRPLVGRKKRARLKKRAVISGVILMLAAFFIKDDSIRTMVTLGAIYEAISILPLTYNLLKRRYNNYEQYEQKNERENQRENSQISQ